MSMTFHPPLERDVIEWLRGTPVMVAESARCDICGRVSSDFTRSDVPIPQDGGSERVVICTGCQGDD